ncbi:MAG: lspA [Acidimicrobiaceae bacterium]|nr:lspA [Acidimicrobiaceae bacterium]
MRRTRLLAALLTAGLVVVLDQVTKTLAVDHLSSGPIHLLGPLSLQLAYNTGVAFSLGTGLTLPIVLIGVGLVVLLVWFLRGAPSLAVTVSLGLVLGGAVGNLSDRVFRRQAGAVVDFIHLGFWPTFNVADAAIVCGCLLLVFLMVRAEAPTGRRTATGLANEPEAHEQPGSSRASDDEPSSSSSSSRSEYRSRAAR